MYVYVLSIITPLVVYSTYKSVCIYIYMLIPIVGYCWLVYHHYIPIKHPNADLHEGANQAVLPWAQLASRTSRTSEGKTKGNHNRHFKTKKFDSER